MQMLLLIGVGGVFLTIGDIFFKFWVESSERYLSLTYGLGMMMYLFGLVALVESFKREHVAVASVLLVLVNVVTLTLVSWYWFGEELSVTRLVGLVVALVAISLLEITPLRL